MKKALERGSPITDEDYPDLPPGIVYDPEES
jgi:hypothetical protein